MSDEQELSVEGDPNPGRRRMLGGLAAGGAVAAGGIVGATATAAATSSGFRKETLSFEVACLGELWREATKANPSDDGDFRAPFLVEGWIYPTGTIPGDGFIPTESGSIGRWFCRGYVAIDSARPEPHTASHQDYMLGSITAENLFPSTMLSSCGLEGSNERGIASTRAVIGGTGDYLAALGSVTQVYFADNTSVFADGSGFPSPCFRFEFDLRLPD